MVTKAEREGRLNWEFWVSKHTSLRLNEAQAGIKIARKNTNNFIYADDTTLMATHEEELKSLLMKRREE